MALTDVKVRNTKPSSKTQRHWDSGGLYLEISGGKLWRFKCRFDGKENLLALGKWKAVSLADARDARDEAKKLLARNVDPSIKWKEEKSVWASQLGSSRPVMLAHKIT
ncbi:MAG: DUF4102 domain-containing protein [Betaproteobacteria bacterium]|nr:MAG: DUF4102 domain-containing protein [Betaproteobacteria bacterium]